jgi:magnesium-transporting ATPase (P-type)
LADCLCLGIDRWLDLNGFSVEGHRGYSIEMAQTMAVVLGQLFFLFNARFIRESSLRLDLLLTNRVVWLAVGILIVLQLSFVYVLLRPNPQRSPIS